MQNEPLLSRESLNDTAEPKAATRLDFPSSKLFSERIASGKGPYSSGVQFSSCSSLIPYGMTDALSLDCSRTVVLSSMLLSNTCSSGRANGMVMGMLVSVIVSVRVRLLIWLVEK